MNKIKAIELEDCADFENTINSLLKQGYKLLNNDCGTNEWGVVTFSAILKMEEQVNE